MPKEKPCNQTNNKPLTPALSSNFRANRAHLTPKLAEATPSTPVGSGRVAARSDVSPSPSTPNNNNGTEDTSPALYANITPRSGARRTKLGGSPITAAGSQTSTPSSNSRPLSVAEGQAPTHSRNPGIGTTGLGNNTSKGIGISHSRPPSVIGATSDNQSLRRTSMSSNSQVGEAASSKFFHADDAQSTVSANPREEKPQLRNNAATFFHASAVPGGARKPSPARSTPSPVFRREAPIRPAAAPPRGAAKASTISATNNINRRSPSPRLRSPPIAPQQKSVNRPPSPLKAVSFESTSTSADSHRVPDASMKATPPTMQARKAATLSSVTHMRKRSLGSNVSNTPIGQRVSPSFSSGTYSRTRTPSLSSSSSPMSAQPPKNVLPLPITSSPELSPKSASFASSTGKRLSISEPFRSPEITPISPTRAESQSQPQSQLQKMNELAANARRERKVLDLEISNSSLLAINRTLERELRKQGAELRRFRRLSRSGRLSAPDGAAVRIPSRHSSVQDDSRHSSVQDDSRDSYSGDDLSHLDSIYETSDDELDSLDSSMRSDSASDSLSHSSSQRARDEKRLLLDLSKHRQILVDSQKMSQSIKRCLTWTDELIREGTKALQYKVHVSDVELGGRVLVREDGEEELVDRGTALLSPAAEVSQADESKFWELSEEAGRIEEQELEEIPPLDAGLDGLPG
ncbi:MAG: hypothetical protein Q9160_007036 [Pyrenula sp. 1 TL-2023]